MKFAKISLVLSLPLLIQTIASALPAQSTQPATLPAADNVLITLKPEKTEFQIDEPILVDLVFHNNGKTEYTVEQDYSGNFLLHAIFVVKDANGQRPPNPYLQTEIGSLDYPSQGHLLKPGGTVTFSRTLNESVRFNKPGKYTIETQYPLSAQDKTGKQPASFLAKSEPVTVTVKEFDKTRRQADIDALLAAYRAGKFDYDKLPFDKKHVFFSGDKEDIARILAFFDEPRLIPFFLDVMEESDINGYAHYALLGLSDRAPVINALEKRLDHPETHNVTNLFYVYSQLRFPNPSFTAYAETYKKRQTAIAPYRGKALALLKADKDYRYPHLASRLCDRTAGDNFLIDYLLHAKPATADIRWCATAIGEVTLRKEDEPLIAIWLNCEEISVRDAAIKQLLRINREKYLPVLREDKAREKHQFSEEVLKLAD